MDPSKCAKCKNAFKDKEKKLSCEICNHMFHTACSGLSTAECNLICKQNSQVHWYCEHCQFGAKSLFKQMISLNAECSNLKTRIGTLEQSLNNKVERNDVVTIVQNEVTELIKEEMKKVNPPPGDDTLVKTVQTEITKVLAPGTLDNITKEQLKNTSIINEVAVETQERERRKCNLVIHGPPESTLEKENRSQDDLKKCEEILKVIDTNFKTDEVNKIFRLGKYNEQMKRPICVEFKRLEVKENLLKSANKLRDSPFRRIGLSHDLTKAQRAEYQRLRAEARAKSDDSTKYVVSGRPDFWKIRPLQQKP